MINPQAFNMLVGKTEGEICFGDLCWVGILTWDVSMWSGLIWLRTRYRGRLLGNAYFMTEKVLDPEHILSPWLVGNFLA
jgi:hypothetical protein